MLPIQGLEAITLKLAPRGKATAFLAVNALISGLAATVAPAVAGFSSDWFASRRLSIELRWTSDIAPHNMTAVDLSGLDFLFVAAVIFGLYSLHRLLAVREEGVIEDAEITAELYDEVPRAVRNLSSVAGLRRLVEFPYSLLRSRGDPPSDEERLGDHPDRGDLAAQVRGSGREHLRRTAGGAVERLVEERASEEEPES
jgi:MFS family permease